MTVTVQGADPQKLIERVAEYLKNNQVVTPPPWAMFVKTGVHKERPPTNPDWWYIRAAAVLRKLYVKGPMGVSRLRKHYGGRHRANQHPPHFAKGSGAIIRKILQQLEQAGLVMKVDKKGRGVSPQGRKLLEQAAKVLIAKQQSSPAS
ncbi:MAG TPA: 30S ribosomal protein S19e [Candidatus Caldiarchaeum subterraneum]|uniref:Small ribosomal subunit protein eS19 n=1 Tax=Caldiarchaeum subterraneum TaxID=311458 RepID=A0A833EC02_CALS0|nr:30S ribosomal protein S19e [Candidatus Caldarchaeum subterraneum]